MESAQRDLSCERLRSSELSKSGLGKSPTRVPLIQVNAMEGPADLQSHIQSPGEFTHDHEVQNDVGPNARRWAAQIGHLPASPAPSGTVIVKGDESAISHEGTAWNIWLEKGEIEEPIVPQNSALNPSESDKCNRASKVKSEASEDGTTDVIGDSNMEQNAIDVLPVTDCLQESALGAESATDVAAQSNKEDKQRSTTELDSSDVQKEAGSDPRPRTTTPSSEQDEGINTFPGLPTLSTAATTGINHRRRPSMIGGPVYMRPMYNARLPSADMGALHLGEYFSPLSLGLRSSVNLPTAQPFLRTSVDVGGQITKTVKLDGPAAAFSSFGIAENDDSAMHRPDITDRSEENTRTCNSQSLTEYIQETKPVNFPDKDNESIGTLQNDRFLSQPQRPYSPGQHPELDVSLPQLPDPFNKSWSQEGSKGQPSDQSEALPSTSLNLECATTVPYARYTEPKVHASFGDCLHHEQRRPAMGQADRSLSLAFGHKIPLADRISQLTASYVGRPSRPRVLESQNSFTPLSDSVSGLCWSEMGEKSERVAGSADHYMADRQNLPHGLSIGRKQVRSESVMPLEDELAKAGVAFNPQTDDHVIKAVYSSVQHLI